MNNKHKINYYWVNYIFITFSYLLQQIAMHIIRIRPTTPTATPQATAETLEESEKKKKLCNYLNFPTKHPLAPEGLDVWLSGWLLLTLFILQEGVCYQSPLTVVQFTRVYSVPVRRQELHYEAAWVRPHLHMWPPLVWDRHVVVHNDLAVVELPGDACQGICWSSTLDRLIVWTTDRSWNTFKELMKSMHQ